MIMVVWVQQLCVSVQFVDPILGWMLTASGGLIMSLLGDMAVILCYFYNFCILLHKSRLMDRWCYVLFVFWMDP